jgi:uncharacterized membrane protein YuzA (DUF378 family)
MTVVMKEQGCVASTIGYYLVIIGAINWGLVGLSDFTMMNLNVVNLLVGGMPTLESLVYIAVGVAGVMTLIGCKCSTCKACRVDEAKK